MKQATLYHNPKCSKSRAVLDMIRQAGIEPVVVEYLKNPPDRQTLKQIIESNGQGAAALLRNSVDVYKVLKLDENYHTDDEIIDAMLAHPELINRPIVVTALGARLCRPIDRLFEIFPIEA